MSEEEKKEQQEKINEANNSVNDLLEYEEEEIIECEDHDAVCEVRQKEQEMVLK